jgi:hypothetical protein
VTGYSDFWESPRSLSLLSYRSSMACVYRKFVVSGDIAGGRPLPIWVWMLPVGFVVLPVTAGQVIGRAASRRRGWARLLTGPSPAPRAWDELFASPGLTGWIRLRLPDGTWVCGLWGPSEATGLRSWASGYPEVQDLLIAELAETDDDGEFLTEGGVLVLTGRSLLVGWATWRTLSSSLARRPQMSKPRTDSKVSENRGGYPAGSKPVSQIKPPPDSVTKPKPEAKKS